MDIQKELREWADKTAKGYVSIAKEEGEKAPSFYTQSNLTKILNSPEVVVLGINPGSERESQLGTKWKRYGWQASYSR